MSLGFYFVSLGFDIIYMDGMSLKFTHYWDSIFLVMFHVWRLCVLGELSSPQKCPVH